MRLVFLIFISFLSFPSLAAEKSQRIVSMSLCSDELLLLLSKPEEIISLSYLSGDPRYSYLNKENNLDLTGIYLNHGLAEEIIPLEPDLILNTRYSAGTAANFLQGFGYTVTTLSLPTTLEQTYQQIEEVATLLDEKEKGARLIQQLQNRIKEAQASLGVQRNLTAVFYSNNGLSFGSGTLRDEFLNTLGIKNLASEQGIVGSGKLSIELLISEQPDFLLIDHSGLHDDKLVQPLLQHPILKQYFPAKKVIVLPSTLFQCAGPSLIEAYELMVQALGEF